jgi:hypothetical protein
MLPESAPDRNLQCLPFDECRRRLAAVLNVLDRYVKDSVLELVHNIRRGKGQLAANMVCTTYLLVGLASYV